MARSFAGWQNDAPACDGGGRAARRGSAEPEVGAGAALQAADTELVEVAGRLRGCVPSGASAPRGYIPFTQYRQGPATVGNTFERRPRRTTIFYFAAFWPKSSTVLGTRRADAARHFRDW